MTAIEKYRQDRRAYLAGQVLSNQQIAKSSHAGLDGLASIAVALADATIAILDATPLPLPPYPSPLVGPLETDAQIETQVSHLTLLREQSKAVLKRLAEAGISTFTTPEGTTWSRAVGTPPPPLAPPDEAPRSVGWECDCQVCRGQRDKARERKAAKREGWDGE